MEEFGSLEKQAGKSLEYCIQSLMGDSGWRFRRPE
jgi:hypothetical protein